MAPPTGTKQSWRCAVAVLVPLAVAVVTIMGSSKMAGLSHEEAVESHRQEREVIWDIPVLDTLALWKRSMGTVGSGKLRYVDSFLEGQKQKYQVLQRYHSKIMENKTHYFDEVLGTWLNVTTNYTLRGNFTRMLNKETTITGLASPLDTAMTPNGHFLYAVTGYIPATWWPNLVTGVACAPAGLTGDCVTNRGYLSAFKRDPAKSVKGQGDDLRFIMSTRLSFDGGMGVTNANLMKVVVSPDGRNLYTMDSSKDTGAIFSFTLNGFTGVLSRMEDILTCRVGCPESGSSNLKGLTDMFISKDGRNVYITAAGVLGGGKVLVYYRDPMDGKLYFRQEEGPAGGSPSTNKYPVSVVGSNDGKHLYVGAVPINPWTAKQSGTNSQGFIFMYQKMITEADTAIQCVDTALSSSTTAFFCDQCDVTKEKCEPTENYGQLSKIELTSSEVGPEYGWPTQWSEKLWGMTSLFGKVENPLTNEQTVAGIRKYLIMYPKVMRMDPEDNFLYVASYYSHRVIAYMRHPKTGMLLYKTSSDSTANYLSNEDSTGGAEGPLQYPVDIEISGDGSSLYVASDGTNSGLLGVIKIEKKLKWLAPTPAPTHAPTHRIQAKRKYMQDPMSYTNKTVCSAKTCKSIWPTMTMDTVARDDSGLICGSACTSSDGKCEAGDIRCAFNNLVTTDKEVVSGREVEGPLLHPRQVVETSSVKWSDAKSYCEATTLGARLCTIDEVVFKEPADKCWQDTDLIWTSTPCTLKVKNVATDETTFDVAGYFAAPKRSRNPKTDGVCLTPDSYGVDANGLMSTTVTPNRVSCCADVICGGVTPSPSHTYAPTRVAPTFKPTATPSFRPTEHPTVQPTQRGWDIRLTYQEGYKNLLLMKGPNGITVTPDWMSVYLVATYNPSGGAIIELMRNATTPNPTGQPTTVPTPRPSKLPTPEPTPEPTPRPTPRPTPEPTEKPTPEPTPHPTFQPIPLPTAQPTPTPTTPEPSAVPTYVPTSAPTKAPTPLPTDKPTAVPMPRPSPRPSPLPTYKPTHLPTPHPTKTPTSLPTPFPTKIPTPAPTTPKPSQIPTPAPTTIPLWYLRPQNSSSWCWTLPKADTPSGLRNGLVPVLARCVNSNSQKWSFDLKRKEIHPQNEYEWCLDSDFDKSVRRPITIFRCGKTFSKKAERGHQQWDWDFPKSGVIKNSATKRCAATGKELYQGRYIQAWFCDDTNQVWDFVPADE